MKTILFLSSASRRSCRTRVAGVQRYFGPADVQVQVVACSHRTIDVRKVVDLWKPAGCIAECGGRNPFPPEDFGRVPTVYLDRDPAQAGRGLFTVSADLAGSATLAAKELLSLGLPNYAFVGFRLPLFWSKVSERAFREAVEMTGHACQAFDGPGEPDLRRLSSLRRWLKALPKPCGLFAASDGTAAEVLVACRQEGVAVPEEIAVLGIGNNEEICKQAKPSLSSICPDFEEAGYLCGELLDLQLRNPKAKPESRTFPPLGVVRRKSTLRLRKADTRVTDAVEFIRQNACSAIRVDDVARAMGCSRRTAEIRFSALMRHTIADEIRSVRLARAFALLRKPNQAIDSIAHLCGYDSDSTLRYSIKALTGLSMREWRKREGIA